MNDAATAPTEPPTPCLDGYGALQLSEQIDRLQSAAASLVAAVDALPEVPLSLLQSLEVLRVRIEIAKLYVVPQ